MTRFIKGMEHELKYNRTDFNYRVFEGIQNTEIELKDINDVLAQDAVYQNVIADIEYMEKTRKETKKERVMLNEYNQAVLSGWEVQEVAGCSEKVLLPVLSEKFFWDYSPNNCKCATASKYADSCTCDEFYGRFERENMKFKGVSK